MVYIIRRHYKKESTDWWVSPRFRVVFIPIEFDIPNKNNWDVKWYHGCSEQTLRKMVMLNRTAMLVSWVGGYRMCNHQTTAGEHITGADQTKREHMNQPKGYNWPTETHENYDGDFTSNKGGVTQKQDDKIMRIERVPSGKLTWPRKITVFHYESAIFNSYLKYPENIGIKN